MKDMDEQQRPKLRLGSKDFERVNLTNATVASQPINVSAILKENLARAQQFGPTFVVREKRKSHRIRDYLAVMFLTNGLLLTVIAVSPKHPLIYVPASAGIVLISISATWVMWVVMDRDQFTSLDAAKKQPPQTPPNAVADPASDETLPPRR